jgi:hypothetical protein
LANAILSTLAPEGFEARAGRATPSRSRINVYAVGRYIN